MALEHIGAVEGLGMGGAGARAEGAHHGSLVVSQGVAILVVLAGEALDVVLACFDRALFGAFFLVCQHVGGQVFEDTTAVRMGAAVTNSC